MPTINRKPISHKEVPYKHYNNTSGTYYNTKQWKNLRNYYIRRHPLCEVCLEHDIITPANEVHHKVPFMSGTTDEDKYSLLVDEDNLLSVCYSCHDKIHRELK